MSPGAMSSRSGGRPHDLVTNAQPDGTGMGLLALLALVVQQQ